MNLILIPGKLYVDVLNPALKPEVFVLGSGQYKKFGMFFAQLRVLFFFQKQANIPYQRFNIFGIKF